MKRRDNGQGSIKQLPSGSWRWQITLGFDKEGKQLLKTGTEQAKEDAQRALTLALADHHRGLLPLPSQVTLADWIPRWLAGKKSDLAPKTEANYQYICKSHLLPLLGDKKLQALKPSDLRDAYQVLAGQGFSRSLLHQVRVILRQALHEALLDELVARNVADLTRLPNFKKIKAARALSVTEAAKFLDIAHKQRLGTLFEFVIATGLRRGEVCALRWEHLNLERGLMHIRENLTVVNGKPTLGAPKTESGVRDIDLAPDTVELLKRHLSDQRAEGTQGEMVFTNRKGQRLYPDSLTKIATRIGKTAGIGHVRFHDLRHTYASLMLAQGVPMEVVSEKMGHSRPSTTADIYRHIYREEHERHTMSLTTMLTPPPLKLRALTPPAAQQENKETGAA